MEKYELIGGPRDGESVVMSYFFDLAYVPTKGYRRAVFLVSKEYIEQTNFPTGYYLMTSEKRYGERLENDEYKYGSWMGKILNIN